MPNKSIIIIGAGIAGLSTGCYGRMNGYRTQIFEMNHVPGGLCTSWRRGGYTIDSCLHWLVGSSPEMNFYRIWEELGAVQSLQMVDPEEFFKIEGTDGKTFTFYTDIDRLKKHMIELSPEDLEVIDEFISGIRAYTRLELPIDKAPDVYNLTDILKIIFKMFPFRKWDNISIQDFGAHFKNPLFREAFALLWVSEFPMSFLLMNLAWMHNKAAGYPIGGSMALSRAVEKRYLDLGGDMHYNSRVIKILVENNRAIGVRLADGSEHRADFIISAADGYMTIFDFLEGKYTNKKIMSSYNKLHIFQPLIHVALGVNRSFEDMPHSVIGINYPLDQPITIAGKKWNRMGDHGVRFHNYDPTLAPAGKTLVTVMFHTDYDYWKSLQENQDRYNAEKEKVADQVVALLERRYPGFASQVEMRDIATPLTFHRYTGNWQGTYQGWKMTPKKRNLLISKSLPGLSNFYMAGQWVEQSGGLPLAAFSGRNVIQILCKKDKKPFLTNAPMK